MVDLVVPMEVVVARGCKRHSSFTGLLRDALRRLITSPERDALSALGEAEVVDFYEVK